MARFDSFLRLVAEQGASDLHFHAGNVPIIRHEGDLLPLPFRTLSELETSRFLLEIMTEEQRAEFEKKREIDFVYELPGVARFRANVFVQSQGFGSVFRVIKNEVPTLDELGMPAAVKRLTDLNNGLVLVTGPTGSGKSTTLAAMVDEINKTSQRHVISIEDPIEYLHTNHKAVITQRQVGKHAESFAGALRSALRESPDVLIVGEMRDLETIGLAIQAAETGVLVIGTLHANSASNAVDPQRAGARGHLAAPGQARERRRARRGPRDPPAELRDRAPHPGEQGVPDRRLPGHRLQRRLRDAEPRLVHRALPPGGPDHAGGGPQGGQPARVHQGARGADGGRRLAWTAPRTRRPARWRRRERARRRCARSAKPERWTTWGGCSRPPGGTAMRARCCSARSGCGPRKPASWSRRSRNAP